eukprot:20985_1
MIGLEQLMVRQSKASLTSGDHFRPTVSGGGFESQIMHFGAATQHSVGPGFMRSGRGVRSLRRTDSVFSEELPWSLSTSSDESSKPLPIRPLVFRKERVEHTVPLSSSLRAQLQSNARKSSHQLRHSRWQSEASTLRLTVYFPERKRDAFLTLNLASHLTVRSAIRE